METKNDITFLKAFLTNNGLPPIYNTIAYNNAVLFTKKDSSSNDLLNKLTVIKDIPDYLTLDMSRGLKVNTVKTLKGHLIDLSLFKGYSEYLSRKISTKSKSNLNRYKNRLETCFNIKYVAYHGKIEKGEYDRIFTFLKDFLIRRFQEKKENNYELQHLQEFHDLCYDMIIQKKANLFVVYNDHTPISIRINMFNNDLAYYIISGYDIDYGKFHLGSIDMLKNIEWCFNNNCKIYDLLKGYDYYKQKWATGSYFNYMHIISKSKISTKGNYIVLKEKAKQFLVESIKTCNLHIPYKNFKKFTYKYINNRLKRDKEIRVSIKNNIDIRNRGSKIDFQKDMTYKYLKKHIYNFLFLNKENLNNISVYKVTDKSNYFEIQGENNNQLLIVDTIKE